MTVVSRPVDVTSRRSIDLAIGILMGLRRCSEREAFDDLVNAVYETGVGPGALARALMELIGGASQSDPHRSDAARMWGYLVPA